MPGPQVPRPVSWPVRPEHLATVLACEDLPNITTDAIGQLDTEDWTKADG